MESSYEPAARFLELARSNPKVRQQVDAALIDKAMENTEAQQSLLDASVQIAHEQGLDFNASDLQRELERDLGLEEVFVVSEEFGDEDGEVDSAFGSCHCRSGCRTPCRYCDIIDDEGGGFEEPTIVTE